VKKVLMLCYYFPPLGLAGTQRAVKFARYLPEFGWQPTVVTVKPVAYWAQDVSLLDELIGIDILRTESWDPQRLLARMRPDFVSAANGRSFAGGVLSWIHERVEPLFLLPDSKILWKFPALQAVRRLMQADSFDVLFSTSPPHSAQLIAAQIKKRSGMPWVADFRDSWTGSAVVREATGWHRRRNERLQQRVVQQADALIAATPAIRQQLKAMGAKQCEWIPNGFDPVDYPKPTGRSDNRFVLCHCGTVTQFSRPDVVLQAMRLLKEHQPGIAARLVLRFVGHDLTGKLDDWIAVNGVGDQVEQCGYLAHHQALQELVDADALLLVAHAQADSAFIPGKTFEYLGSKKPILLLSDVLDTVSLLADFPQVLAASPNDPQSIAGALADLLGGKHRNEIKSDLARFERKFQASQLGALFDRFADHG